MENNQRKGFTFLASFAEQIEMVAEFDTQKAYLLCQAIFKYGLYREEPSFGKDDVLLKVAFAGIKPVLDNQWTNSGNGKKGGAPKGNKNALTKGTSENNRIQPNSSENSRIQAHPSNEIEVDVEKEEEIEKEIDVEEESERENDVERNSLSLSDTECYSILMNHDLLQVALAELPTLTEEKYAEFASLYVRKIRVTGKNLKDKADMKQHFLSCLKNEVRRVKTKEENIAEIEAEIQKEWHRKFGEENNEPLPDDIF